MIYCPNCGQEIPEESTFCLKCGKTVKTVETEPTPNNITENLKEEEKLKNNGQSIGAGCGCLMIIIFIIILFSSCTSESQPKSFQDMTNKEYKQFLEWDKKQKQKEYDNAPAFGN